MHHASSCMFQSLNHNLPWFIIPAWVKSSRKSHLENHMMFWAFFRSPRVGNVGGHLIKPVIRIFHGNKKSREDVVLTKPEDCQQTAACVLASPPLNKKNDWSFPLIEQKNSSSWKKLTNLPVFHKFWGIIKPKIPKFGGNRITESQSNMFPPQRFSAPQSLEIYSTNLTSGAEGSGLEPNSAQGPRISGNFFTTDSAIFFVSPAVFQVFPLFFGGDFFVSMFWAC